MAGALLPGMRHLQNLHPLVVMYPVAFLTGAAVFFLLAWISRNDGLAMAAFWLLAAGALSSLMAAGTGLYAEPGVMIARSVRAELLIPHERLMLTTVVLSLVLFAWSLWERPFPRKGRALFLVLWLVLLGVMVKGADDGGRMVFDYNAGGNACPQPIEFDK